MLIRSNIHSLAVLPTHQYLVSFVEDIQGASRDRLMLHLFLGLDGHLQQPVLADGARASNAPLRQFLQQRERSEEIVKNYFTSLMQASLLHQIQDNIRTLPEAVVLNEGVLAAVWLGPDQAAA